MNRCATRSSLNTLGDWLTSSRPSKLISHLTIFSTQPVSVFWVPAKHNQKTTDKLKQTQDAYLEKENEFKLDCHKRLEDRLKIYDARNIPNEVPLIKKEQEELDQAEVKQMDQQPVKEETQVQEEEDNFGEEDLINEIYNMN